MTQRHDQIVRRADQTINRAVEESRHITSLLNTIRSTETFVEQFVERRRANRGHSPERRSKQPRSNGAHA